MNISFLHKPLGFLLFIALLFMIISKPIGCTINAIETNVIKRFNPDHKTRYEVAEEKEKERQRIAEQEEKRIADEIALENAEDLKERQMSALVSETKVENSLKKKGYIFNVGYCSGFYIVDNNIWACGDLLCDTNTKKNYYCPAIVVSEDDGNDYRLLEIFEELGRIDDAEGSSSILFIGKNSGYLSIYSMNGYSIIYKTGDGGHTWNAILSTKNTPVPIGNIKRTRVVNQNIYLIISFQKSGYFNLIESNDSGKSWIYKRNNKEVAKTSDRGLTWEVVGMER